MDRRPGHSKDVRERAVRLVLTGEDDHSSRWAAIQSISADKRIGTGGTLAEAHE